MSKYDKYKDTNIEWIGEIPEHWDYTRMVNIGTFTASGIDKKINDDEKLVKIINFTDIYSNSSNLLDSRRDYMEVTAPSYKVEEHQVRKGDLILLPSSETFEDLGSSALVDEDLPNTAFSYHVLRFQFEKPFDHRYKKYLTNNYNLLNYFSSEGKGTTRKILNRDSFKNACVVVPPLPEQTQISTYLDNKTSLIDKLINNNKKLIKLLEEKRTALINKVITKGLDPNVKMKDSGIEWIGEIPEHWEISNIKRVADIYGRIGFRGYTTQDIVPEGDGAITLSPSNIKSTRMLLDSCTYLSWEKYKESPEIMIFKKDIIFVKTGSTIGKVAMVETYPQEMTINPQLIVLKNLKVDAKYLYYNMVSTSFQYQVKREVRGGSTPAINQEKINNLTIVEAPLSEQTQISSYLDNKTSLIDKAIKEFKAENELLKEYRQSLISNVVTGKINVQDYQNN